MPRSRPVRRLTDGELAEAPGSPGGAGPAGPVCAGVHGRVPGTRGTLAPPIVLAVLYRYSRIFTRGTRGTLARSSAGPLPRDAPAAGRAQPAGPPDPLSLPPHPAVPRRARCRPPRGAVSPTATARPCRLAIPTRRAGRGGEPAGAESRQGPCGPGPRCPREARGRPGRVSGQPTHGCRRFGEGKHGKGGWVGRNLSRVLPRRGFGGSRPPPSPVY